MARAPKTTDTPGYDIGISAKDLLGTISIEDVVKKVRDAAQSAGPFDIATLEGRDACKAAAYKVARTKTTLESGLAATVAKAKETIKREQSVRLPLVKALDALRDTIREPVTQYEAAEIERVAKLDADLAEIEGLPVFDTAEPSEDDIAKRMKRLNDIRTGRNEPWGEDHEDRAKNAMERADGLLKQASQAAQFRQWQADQEAEKAKAEAEAEAIRNAALKAETDRLAKVRADQAAAEAEAQRIIDERQAIERERQEAAQAAENARIAGHKAALNEIGAPVREAMRRGVGSATVQAIRDELAKSGIGGRAWQEFEAQAGQAFDAALSALDERKAFLEAEEEKEKLALEAKAKAEADALVEAERARARADAEAAQREADARAKDTERRRIVHQDILDALIEEARILEEEAKAILRAIATGKIPNVSIAY